MALVPEPVAVQKHAKQGADRLTDRQRDILAYIREHVAELGYPPTVREIGLEFDIKSPNGVMCHLQALQRKGVILRADVSRGITLVPSAEEQERKGLLAKLSTLTTEDLRGIVAERFGDTS